MKRIFFLFLLISSQLAYANLFEEAQRAAVSGQYSEVVRILTLALGDTSLSGKEKVVARCNRGIAHSLLGNYREARMDLLVANRLDPQHALTLNQLGVLEEVEGNVEKARDYFKQAAEEGFTVSYYRLANLILKEDGNHSQAAPLYQAAVDDGHWLSLAPLGYMYLKGNGVNRDTARAHVLLERAVENDVIDGHYYLGLAYTQGLGVEVDLSLGFKHLVTAAQQGHADAQNQLGYLYRSGRGVEQNFVRARYWYQLASDQGNNDATNRLAWLMATCPVADVCDGETALALSLKAVRKEDSATNLDSLAAAYARLGEFDKATSTIRRLLNSDDPKRFRYRARLDLYDQEKPYQL